MAAEIITKEDLEIFKEEIFKEMKTLLEQLNIVQLEKELDQVFLRSHTVESMLKLSPSKLQHLRLNGTIPFFKLKGVIFYNKKDVIEALNKFRKYPH
jgi:hypothetical protein